MRPSAMIALAATTVLALATVAACTGSSSQTAGSAGVQHNSSDYRAASSASRPEAGATGRVTRTVATRLAPQLIVTGSVSVVVRSVNDAAARAEAFVLRSGGRTDTDDRDERRGSIPSVRLVLRVPNDDVPSLSNELASLGRVTHRSLSTRDVTTEVADVASRVSSAEAAIAALRQLYRKSTNVSDVIRVGTALSQREASLEALQAQQRALAGQVSLATITVAMTQRHPVKVVTHATQRSGFVGGLGHGWHAFTATVAALATALGAVLPFLVVLLVLGGAALVVYRRRRPRPAATSSSD